MNTKKIPESMFRHSQLKTFSIATLTLISLCISAQVAFSQQLFPIKGGTGTMPDPDNKSEVLIVAENEKVRITIGPSRKFKPKVGNIWTAWIKVENLLETPLAIDTSKFYGVDDSGESFAGLEALAAIRRFTDSAAPLSNAIGNAVAGPLSGPSITAANERAGTAKLLRDSLHASEVPGKTFKAGVIYFDKPKKKTNEFKVMLVGLWNQPIIFTTVESSRLKSQ